MREMVALEAQVAVAPLEAQAAVEARAAVAALEEAYRAPKWDATMETPAREIYATWSKALAFTHR